MQPEFTLDEVDRDGAIQEAIDNVSGDSRARFLTKATIATGGLIGGGAILGALASPASAATNNDVAIANFALTLEYLEAEFYTEAVRMGALRGETLRFAQVVGAHERAHVAALRKMLGAAAVRKPTFNFRGTTENAAKFEATAVVLEETGVAAYKGQAGLIDSTAILKAALAIHSVEARHASWIRRITGASPAPAAFDKPKTKAQILAAVNSTRFITGQPRTTARGTPSFTG
jgi:Ferritin-like domain